jgi:hypothetical protein
MNPAGGYSSFIVRTGGGDSPGTHEISRMYAADGARVGLDTVPHVRLREDRLHRPGGPYQPGEFYRRELPPTRADGA